MNPIQKTARTAGYLYLLMGLTAPIGLIYVPGSIVVLGDPSATAMHLRTSESLERMGITSELFHQLVFAILALTLYRLLKGVGKSLARMMLVLALFSVPIVFLNVLNEIAALMLSNGANLLSAFDKGQLDALAYFFLRLHGRGIDLATIFWGLWLFPFGVLVVQSGFIPRFLGVLLLIACFGNLAGAVTSLLLPGHAMQVSRAAMVLGFGEMPIVIWFLIWGARNIPSGKQQTLDEADS
jgi:hypothetical protein